MDAVTDLNFRRHASELRETWQVQLLDAAIIVHDGVAHPRDQIGACIISILAHNFDEALPVLLALLGARGVSAYRSLTTAAKIAKTGHVMADYIDRFGRRHKNQKLFFDTRIMEGDFRRLADRLRFNDQERTEMFAALKRWVVCDYRLDPSMNPADPDAKRLVVH